MKFAGRRCKSGGLYLIEWPSSKPDGRMAMDKGIATFEYHNRLRLSPARTGPEMKRI